jgi:copper chaperone
LSQKTVSLNVHGMSCNHCVNAIESSLKEVDGIEAVTVDLKGNKVTVSYNEGVVNLDKVKETIEDAGYDVA